MAEIFLTNTLTRKREKFVPIKKGQVGIYTCGPTVYRDIHIGNLRTYIAADLLKRTFVYNDYSVKHVKNITDVGHMRLDDQDHQFDPVVAEALKEGKTPDQIADSYTKKYLADEKSLNILPADQTPKATEHIKEMIDMTAELIKKGFAYETGGTVYFDVKKFEKYGKLSGNTLDKSEKLLEAVRVSVETDKKGSADFALWKKAEEGRAMSWDSPWGKGFPGWHIECSAMSTKYLGNHFDIHTGGEDLVFPHHEDEIAQSEAAFGEKFVNYWVHAGYLLVDGKKMARSAGNFYTLADIEKKGFSPLAFRYLTLTTQYKSRLNFTWESLEASQNALNNLYREISSYGSETKDHICAKYEEPFAQAIADDLDLPKALAVVHSVVGSDCSNVCKLTTLLRFDEVLGLGFKEFVSEIVPSEVSKFIEEREKARSEKNFSRADEYRKKIAEKGFEVVDTERGPKLKKIISK